MTDTLPFKLPDYHECIYAVLRDKKLLAQACVLADAEPSLSRNHDRKGLRASDAGRCRLELWAELHDAYDKPEEANGLLRMLTGSLTGAMVGACIKVGVEAAHPTLSFSFEEEAVERDGIIGHIDGTLSLRSNRMPLETVECKMTMSTRKQTEASRWWLIQSCRYALMAKVPTHAIVCFQPSLQKVGGVQGDMISWWRFPTVEHEAETLADYERLKAALGDDPPVGDAVEAFRCNSCRYTECDRNPEHHDDKLLNQLEASYAKRNG